LGFIWLRKQSLLRWSLLPKSRRRIGNTIEVALILAVTFVANRHKPDEFANDALMYFAVLVTLLFWGLYRIKSRFLDALHARLSKRRVPALQLDNCCKQAWVLKKSRQLAG